MNIVECGHALLPPLAFAACAAKSTKEFNNFERGLIIEKQYVIKGKAIVKFVRPGGQYSMSSIPLVGVLFRTEAS